MKSASGLIVRLPILCQNVFKRRWTTVQHNRSMSFAKRSNTVLDSAVKVFSTQSSPEYSMPWQNKHPEYFTGSGFVTTTNSGLRILTNAHIVADSTYVEVRKYGAPDRFEASVEAVAHECDVAVLNVRNRKFWKDVAPLQLADDLPSLQDAIAVVGYPTGGDNLSVTTGVVSRIEMQNYAHSATCLLTLQIDAAVNSGNSGGPAIKDGKVCGMAFQNLVDAEGIGYVIPVPVLKRFLDSLNSGHGFQGFCALSVKCQVLTAHLETWIPAREC